MSSLLVLGVMGHPTWWDAKVAWWLVSKNAILKLLGFTVLPTALNCRSVMCSRVISCMEDYLPYCWDYSISTRTAQNKEKDCGKLWVYIFELSWSWALRHQATGKLYHLRLWVEYTLYCNLQSWARTLAVLVIGLYELLNPKT